MDRGAVEPAARSVKLVELPRVTLDLAKLPLRSSRCGGFRPSERIRNCGKRFL